MVDPFRSIDKATTWQKYRFILSEKSDFHMFDYLSIEVNTYRRMLTSLSLDGILLARYVNFFTNLRGLPLKMEMAPLHLKFFVFFGFTWGPMPTGACHRL